MALATSLLDPLCPAAKSEIASSFWRPISTHPIPGGSVVSEAYWRFYEKACERALYDAGRHVLARTHQDLADIIEILYERHPRDFIREKLRPRLTKAHSNETELADRAIDLAASLLLMIDCTNVEYGFNGSRQLEWKNDSLENCVQTHFNIKPMLGHEGVKLPRVFNARNLECIAGIEIMPTANLLDHLRLTDDDTRLYVFHHASFLKAQSKHSMLPEDLVEETRRTLALLFPQSDPGVRKWYRPSSEAFSLDPHLVLCGNLKTDDRQIENFVYWHDRLVVLKQVFDEATPQNLSQWWHDRRNGVHGIHFGSPYWS